MIARWTVCSCLALVALAAVAQADSPSPAQLAATMQVGTAGKRTIAVVADATVTYPCDQFAVTIVAMSGLTTPDAAPGKIDDLAGRVQDALRTAGLGTLALDDREPLPDTVRTSDAKVATYRRYRVAVASLAAGRAVQACLTPFTGRRDEVRDHADLKPSQLEAHIAKLDADPTAAQAEARRAALVDARAEAEQDARALGMRLGPPVTIGVLDVSRHGSIESAEQGFNASGVVVFEMTE